MIIGLCVHVCDEGMSYGLHERQGHSVRPAISPPLKVLLDRAQFV